MQRLAAAGAATRQDLDQARSSLATAEADVRALDAQVALERVELGYYRVVAPTADVVGDIPVRVGDRVTSDTLLTTIDQNEVLELYVEVPAERAARVRLGMPVEILDAGGAPLGETRVSFISPRVSADTQTVLVKCEIDNEAGALRSAQLVRARLHFSQRVGPAVPVLAVTRRNGQHFVWLVRAQAEGELTVEERAVEVGPIQGQRYPVVGGLEPGARVVVSGVQKLQPGARVTPVPPAPAPR